MADGDLKPEIVICALGVPVLKEFPSMLASPAMKIEETARCINHEREQHDWDE